MVEGASRTDEPARRAADGPPAGSVNKSRPDREPAIRTMRSDISEFLKKTKPSLVSLLTREAQQGEYRAPRPRVRLWAGAAAGALALMAILWISGRFLFGSSGNAPPTMSDASPPYFRFEQTSEIVISPTPQAFLNAVNSIPADPSGSFRRMAIRIRDNNGAGALPGLPEFLGLAGGRLPGAFTEGVLEPPQLFRYQPPTGRSELGLAVTVRNPARALQSLLDAEPSLPQDLAFLFSGALPPPALAPYADITYKNMSFRYLPPDGDMDRGLGYLLFPARRLIVMATSEGAMRAVIDRLFQGR